MRRMFTRIAIITLGLAITASATTNTVDPTVIKQHMMAAALDEDLARVDEHVRAAEDDVMHFLKKHDVLRIKAQAAADSLELQRLCTERAQLHSKLAMKTDAAAATSNRLAAVEKAIAAWDPKFVIAAQRESELDALRRKLERFKVLRAELWDKLMQIKVQQSMDHTALTNRPDWNTPNKPLQNTSQ